MSSIDFVCIVTTISEGTESRERRRAREKLTGDFPCCLEISAVFCFLFRSAMEVEFHGGYNVVRVFSACRTGFMDTTIISQL